MSVYFVYRSHYDNPTLNHLKKFDSPSVLGWFQKYWQEGAAHADDKDYLGKLLGSRVYGFYSIFEAIRDYKLSPPKSIKDLQNYLTEYLYVEGEILFGPHSIQVLTNDDELQLAYYFFDDNFLEANAEKARFLLHEDWKLPDNFSSDSTRLSEPCTPIHPDGGGTGTTYCAFLSYSTGGNLEVMDGPICINRTRLPNLVSYLSKTIPGESCDWPFELRLIRSQLSEQTEQTNAFDLERSLEAASRYPVAKITNRTV